MLKYEINPAFLGLKDEILALPSRFEQEGEIIYGGRNLIKVMTLGDLVINVKSFKRPHILNRFIYASFRKSKAERSYLNALRLLEMGIGTPQPVAYLIFQDLKGVKRSYYISIQQPCDYILLDLLKQRPPDFDDLFRAYVRFVYDFHRKGVYFVDLSTGNTLLDRNPGEGEFQFFLVDLNRTNFHRRALTPYEGIHNFCRIDLEQADLDFIVREYAALTGETVEHLWKALSSYKRKEKNRRRTKRFFRLFKKGKRR